MTDFPEQLVYAETPTGRKVQGYCRLRGTVGQMAIIIGPPGIGKSMTLRRFADDEHVTSEGSLHERRGRGYYVAMTPQDRVSYARTLNAVSSAILGYGETGRRAQHLFMDACEAARGPIVIDEAQQLTIEALDECRSAWDRYRTRFVFAGNDTFGARYQAERRGALAQFASRVGTPLRIAGVTADDFGAIAAANGVTDAAVLDVLAYAVVKRDLRAFERALLLSRAIEGPTPSVATVRDAVADELGEAIPRRLPSASKQLGGPARPTLRAIDGGRSAAR